MNCIASGRALSDNSLMPRRSTFKPAHQTAAQTYPPCQAPGCGAEGRHRCPKSPRSLGEYLLLCTDHAREHNQRWNYFEGFTEEDFERYYQESRVGHRPTWKFGMSPGAADAELKAAMERFFSARAASAATAREALENPLTPQERKALRLFDFDRLPAQTELKQRYKELAKLYHPDVNKGSAANEERLKEINLAYSVLKKRVQP